MFSDMQFFDKTDALHRVMVQHGNAPSALAEVDTLIQDMDVRREFFHTLDNPEWIVALQNAGYFHNPPATGHGQKLEPEHPVWPESRYLARMAPLAPSEVATVFASLQTDNMSIVENMISAGIAMPAEFSARLVERVKEAAQTRTPWFPFKDASDLCVHLAEGRQTDAALTLADSLFTPAFDEGQDEPRRRDMYWYFEGLKKLVPVLVPDRPLGLLKRMCDWLKAAVDAKDRVDQESGSDLSYLWRPAIEEHEQNRRHDFAGSLVGCLRQGFEIAIETEGLSFDAALSVLQQYTYLIFRRLRLHLINEFAEKAPAFAREAMLNRGLFDDDDFKHEYAVLVGRRLSLLTPEEQTGWLGWIDAGPDMSNFDDVVRAREGRAATDEDRRKRIEYWQLNKLHCVREHLQPERRQRYEQLLAQYGEPELADLNTRISTSWGVQSPITLDTLAAMNFEQVLDTVSSWQPDETDFRGPRIEGLVSTFGQYVATQPEALSRHSTLLVGRPAGYVREFLDQMESAVKNGLDVDGLAVLSLCKWVVTRPRDERTMPRTERDVLVDQDWQWTRNQIASFVEAVCEAKAGDTRRFLAEDYRAPLRDLLESLHQDPGDSYVVHDASQDDPRLRDYMDLAINSPRGKALRAVLEYAHWVADQIKETDAGREVVPGGFDAMPEVRAILQWHVEAPNRTIPAMAIIGSQISLILWIDESWLEGWTDRLFDLQGIDRDPPDTCGWAAWNAFLAWTSPSSEAFRLFQSQFAYAVEQAARIEVSEPDDCAMNHLGEHLMVLYGRGNLALDDDGGLLRRFLATANSNVRRHAIGFIGEFLEGPQEVPGAVIERFMALWREYWEGPGKDDAERDPGSWLFGTWFESGKFPEEWALEQLEQVVDVAESVEPEHTVAEQFAKIAACDPTRSVRILNKMIRADREGWRAGPWIDVAKEILEIALDLGGEAHAIAVALIDYLGRRGYVEFGELLRRDR